MCCCITLIFYAVVLQYQCNLTQWDYIENRLEYISPTTHVKGISYQRGKNDESFVIYLERNET